MERAYVFYDINMVKWKQYDMGVVECKALDVFYRDF